jgi:2-C-methyl-D-erythritol 2,4-cyclodiphosphate synthase
MRVGIGFDSHPFEYNRRLRLGGVEIPHPRGLRGHSDGDALLHAVTDALLGAAGAGSIGDRFPDSDPRWKGAASAVFASAAAGIAAEKGFSIGNLDTIVIGETPRIAPHAAAIQVRLAEILGTHPDRVSVRGTSTNGLGFLGRQDGLAAVAVVLLEKK